MGGRDTVVESSTKQPENTENEQLKLDCPLLTEMHKVCLTWLYEQQQGAGV